MRSPNWAPASWVAVVAVVGALHACDETRPLRPECCPAIDKPGSVTVSEPLPAIGVAPSAHSAPLSADLAARASALSSSAAERLVYVSLPGTAFPTAIVATIRNAAAGASLAQPIVHGGFDPIPIPAGVGDTITVDIRSSAALLARVAVPVPRNRRPGVVRTSPSRGKRDVALNTRVTIIFSEPIAPSTLTTSSVELRADGVAIPGTIEIVEGGVAAEFVPLRPLRENTVHRLVITTGVRDVEGEGLQSDVSVEFTTGSSSKVPVTSVEVTPHEAALQVGDVLGDSVQLALTVNTAHGAATDREVIWSTSDPMIAVVSSNGLVTARAPGVATVLVTSEGQQATARISVVLIAVASINIGPLSPTADLGATTSLVATSYDRNGRVVSRRERLWETDNPGVAEVDQRGRVTGVAAGTATITVTSEGVSGSTTITVGLPLLADRVDVVPPVMAVKVNDTLHLRARAYRCSASLGGCTEISDPPVDWFSADRDIADVDGGRVIARSGGMVAITAVVDGIRGLAPVTVMRSAPLTFAALSAGNHATCGITTAGAAHCWGDNFFGQLGTGEVGIGSGARPSWTPAAVAPLPVAGPLTFASVSAGAWHACGLLTDGAAYCWGQASLGRLGELGPFDEAKCSIARQTETTEVACVPAPIRVPGVPPFRALVAGGVHACGLTATGAAYCWGSDWYGAVGDGGGATSRPLTATPVAGGHNFAALSAGGWHTCGLTTEGKLYCWGFNYRGQLGDGSAVNRDIPVPVAGDLTFRSVNAGESHTCGITTAGRAYCWGDNYYGQLGDGSQEERRAPSAVAGGSFASVKAGSTHSCGLSPDGAAYCWGGGWDGALGEGSRSVRSSPVPVAGGLSFEVITVGLSHSCGLTTARIAYCWGWNRLGQLGDGSAVNRPTPVRVIGQP